MRAGFLGEEAGLDTAKGIGIGVLAKFSIMVVTASVSTVGLEIHGTKLPSSY